jgi:hypothetical protein
MVREKDSRSRIQDSGKKGLGTGGWGLVVLLVTCHASLVTCLAQQPQSSNAPVFAANAKYVQGVGPGYWPTAGAGLALNLAAGTAFCGFPPVLVTYAGGTLTLAASATNYVFLDPAANCAPASNTAGFSPGHIPLAKVVTGASSITSVTEARNWFVPQPIGTDAAGRAVSKYLNGIRFADQFSGASTAAKIDAALADMGTTPGVLVAAPPLGFGSPTNWRNHVAFLDFRQAYDPIDTITDDPDRVALLLLENRLVDMTTRPVTGTVTLTNGSTAVTGVGTHFLTQLANHLGRSIKLDADPSTAWAMIGTVTDDTYATLVSAYPGTGGTGPASYFRTELGMVINSMVSGGTPNTGSGGESVGLSVISNRSGGSRGVWAGNFNLTYSTRNANAAAVGLELDLTNDTGVDGTPGAYLEQALRILSAGSKKPTEGIYIGNIFPGGEFQRAIAIDNSYASRGVSVRGPSNHVYLIPTTDNNSPMITGRNAADSATQWQVNNDGSAQFSTMRAGPATTSYVANPMQNLINDSVNSIGTLNAVHSATLLGLNQNNTTANQIGTYGVSASEHTASSKPYVEGVEGDAYHQTAGSVDYLIGVAGYSNMSGSGGTVTNMMALYAFPNDRGAGSVTNNYGLYVDTQTAGTSNYSIYTAGTAPAQFGGPVISGLNAVSFSATPTFDAKLGNTQKITLTGNLTSSTLSNATAGEQINFIICQDGNGNRTFTWPSNVKGGMTIGSTASKCSAQNFIFDGTNAYALSTGVTNM